MKDKIAYLIDHEAALDIDVDTIKDISDKNWPEKYWKYHIFYDFLNKSIKETKKHYFNEFAECLKTMDLRHSISCINQLKAQGFYTGQMEYACEYLENVRKNSSNFVHLLQALI